MDATQVSASAASNVYSEAGTKDIATSLDELIKLPSR